MWFPNFFVKNLVRKIWKNIIRNWHWFKNHHLKDDWQSSHEWTRLLYISTKTLDPYLSPNNAFIDEIFSRNESQWFCAQNVRIGILNFVLIFSGGGKIFWQKRISPAIKKSDQNSNLSAESLAFILRKDYLINASLGEIWGSKVLVTIYRRRVHTVGLKVTKVRQKYPRFKLLPRF